jgi:signal peptidase I
MDVEDERREKGRRRFCLDLLITAAAVFVLFRVIAGIAVVQGDSMKPNLTNGSVILFLPA